MATFSRTPQTRALDRTARLQSMMDMPFTLGRNLAEQAQQGIVDSFGLGTVVRDIAIPQGNTERQPSPLAGVPVIGAITQGYEGALDLLNATREQQPSLSEDEYKASPFFRTDIPFEQGMTEDRAASLAAFYDQKKVREYFGSKRPISTFIGQFAGQALDPINYVPVFGQAAEAAAVARLGTIGGRMLVGASDAAINTAAFGLMTAGLREEYGDDVSWQAMTNEIAMSALIGGVFSGVAPLVSGAWNAAAGRSSRRAEARIANELADIRSLKESRAVLNEAVGTLAETGDVNLSPNSAAIAERITTEVTGRAAAVRALDAETANINKAEAVAITPSGQRVNVRPEIVDASTLVRATGDLQVRNRSSAASNAQVEEIAVNLDPARLMPSVDADSGAPIVGSDNVIDSGNGRVMAIARAYEAYPARAGAYRKALEDAGYDLTGIEKPVLINRRTTELSREARALFNAEANAPRAAQMNAVELASMDRNALEGTLDILDASPITSPGNRAFVQRFMGNLSPSARGALVDGAGNLNADGARRIENALVASAYGDVDAAVLRRFAEATDDNTRAIVGAMSDVAGRWAQMRQAIKRGDISPEYDMTTELTEALRRIGGWREQAKRESRPVSVVIKEGMAQIDMLSGEISPEAQVMIGAFYKTNSFTQAAGRETIADLLGRIVDATEELGRPQLFETADVGKLEIIRNASNNVETDLFAPVGAVDRIEEVGGGDRAVAAAADSQGGGRADVETGSVAERMTRRFEAAGRPTEEARATAELVDAFYTQQAERLGLSVEELEARFGLPEVRQGGETAAAALNQPAYHGTPHLFDTFSTEKIGTGEGNQAFGWGLYFAGKRDVAEFYRDKLSAVYRSEEEMSWGGKTALQHYEAAEKRGEYGKMAVLENIMLHQPKTEIMARLQEGIEDGDSQAVDGLKYLNSLPKEAFPATGGRLFEVEIPDDKDLLDFDKPLANQSPKVKEALKASGLLKEFKENLSDFGSPQNSRGTGKGTNLYSYLSWKLGGDKAASLRLAEVGIPGHRYPAGTIANVKGGGHNYVIYDESVVSVSRFEQGGDNPRGAIQLGDTNIISLFETADASTALHETGHLFLSMLKGMGEKGDAPGTIKADWESVREWWRNNADAVAADANASGRAKGVTGKNVIDALELGTTGDAAKDRAIDVGMQEQWARGFEAYVREGKAPSAGLARAFEQFKQWLTDIYRRATDLNVNLSPEIRQVFDNLLGAKKADAEPELGLGDAAPVRVRSSTLMANDTVQVAAARVGKPEDIKQMALAHGVDPVTGDFVEMSDIAQIREEGRLTGDDEADLAAADEAFDNSEAWGRALDAAVSCLV